ncbi:bifunctional phosphatase IMPL2, chloroplastic-like isoform X2 [Macadamia integrifolia]|uniref:bifunctional phosphatase IMPL2, chloroplastic-like isoform X2 n=1 Tax=Macadamia integrifolia TaxID=60698 RepID=UPI001C4EED30|nr:bifunctional phosphatase IMPL2, chloroplastic-like isoform X2 [Macadamia integrifolia]
MISHPRALLQNNPKFLPLSPLISPKSFRNNRSVRFSDNHSPPPLEFTAPRRRMSASSIMNPDQNHLPNGIETVPLGFEDQLHRFVDVANNLADSSGAVIRTYFRKSFEILDKDDLSPVTIADREAEESMVSIILENFPSHAIFGEENGWRCKEKSADYVWVLDPIDGTKSFITGKPLFGTLIALLYKGKPILGVIDQPILRERWIGVSGSRTTLNGEEVSTRSCAKLSQAYLYTTSPHLFGGDAEEAFARVRNKPYDFLSLIPVIEGAGGVITDWSGHQLHWEASSDSQVTSFNVLAAGGKQLHQLALDSLEWQ